MLWLLSLAGVLLLYTLSNLISWRKNFLAARDSGLPCIIVPALPTSLPLRIVWPILHPLLNLLPAKCTNSWMGHLEAMSQWNDGYQAYKQVNSDAYFLVAPGDLLLLTCCPGATDYIQHQRDAFRRPVELFKAIGHYGDNLASSEGAQWRRMRRLVSYAFSDKNHRQVWNEAIYQAPKMVAGWSPDRNIPLNADSMKMSQSVISKAAFGYRMWWDGETERSKSLEQTHAGMSYVDASRGLVQNVLLIIGLPQYMLRYSPFSRLRQAYKYDISFRDHLGDAIRRGHMQLGDDDILNSLLKGAEDSNETLSDADILGNAFLFMIGGQETTATSMQLAVIFLALNMEAQKQMQLDIDRIVGSRKPEDWSYDADLPQFLEGWIGAVMYEELRLIPPIPAVIRRTIGDQVVDFDGTPRTIPANTYVALSALGAHRNPKYWPHSPRTKADDPWHARSNLDNDLEEFRPGRWFAQKADETTTAPRGRESSIFRPQRGAYFPFSEGVRACVGRRFAQTEYAAVLAVIFSRYSVELDVREWASDEEVDRMSPTARRNIWQKVAKLTRDTIRDNMGLLISMHLKHSTEFPIRVVPRGKEQWVNFS